MPKIALVAALLVYIGLMVAGRWGVVPHRLRRRKPADVYVLVTANGDREIEWVLRGLERISEELGKTVEVAVIDIHSEDLTLAIVRRFQSDHLTVRLVPVETRQEAARVARHMLRERRGRRATMLRIS